MNTSQIQITFLPNGWHILTSQPIKKRMRWGAENVPLSITPQTEANHPGSYTNMLAKNREDGSIKIGPLIGILTMKGKTKPFRGNIRNFVDIIATAKKIGGLVFIFTPENIDWKHRQIHGYYLNQKGWSPVLFPFPDVVYNRIPYREEEQKPKAQLTLERLSNFPNLYLYNPHFFNKWTLFEWLKQFKTLPCSLPETAQIETKNQLHDFLETYQSIYLKPIRGKAGNGIIRIDKSNDHYLLKYQDKDIQHKKCKTLHEAWNLIQPYIRKQGYIIQQGVPLLTYQGNPFDCRVLVQKNGKGEWVVTGVGIRVAGRYGITTHVPRGGKIAKPHQVLKAAFHSDQYADLMRRIEECALKMALHIEHHVATVGEMSMDLGISADGKLWFFEANAKPMKFDEPDIRQRSLIHIIQYAQYLSFFK